MVRNLLIQLLILIVFLYFSSCQYKYDESMIWTPPPDFPEFPIPYPEPSALTPLPNKFISGLKNLADVDSLLTKALNESGYYSKSYYYISNGFALVTQLEQINEDGTPKPEEERWGYDVNKRKIFSIADYLKALFTSNPGYYRCIVFLITRDVLMADTIPPTRGEAYSWLNEGGFKLPVEIGTFIINDEYDIFALIYEFKKSENNPEAEIIIPSNKQGRTHLEKSNIWENVNTQ